MKSYEEKIASIGDILVTEALKKDNAFEDWTNISDSIVPKIVSAHCLKMVIIWISPMLQLNTNSVQSLLWPLCLWRRRI